MVLNFNLKVLVLVWEWKMSWEEIIVYGEWYGVEFFVKKFFFYSIDCNIFGCSIEVGFLEDFMIEFMEEIYLMIKAIVDILDELEYVDIGFEKGIFVSLNGVMLDFVILVECLNEIVGNYGVGCLDMVENWVVGIKFCEIYEVLVLLVLIDVYWDLESLI